MLVLTMLLFIASALSLVFLVLLHSGKGGGLSDMFGGGLGAAASGSTVMEKNLDRITVVVALIFGFNSVILSLLMGVVGWFAVKSIGAQGILVSLVESVVLGAVLGGLYLLGIRLTTRKQPPPAVIPEPVPDDVTEAILDLDLDPDLAEGP